MTPKRLLHKTSLNFDIISTNEAQDIENQEVLDSVEKKLDEMKENPSIVMESIDIRETMEFDYDNVDVSELMTQEGTITPNSFF